VLTPGKALRRRWTLAIALAYVGVLALIAFWPTPVDRPMSSQLAAALAYLHRHGIPRWVDYNFVESAANVVLFVPFGLLAAALLPRRTWWYALLLGFAASCAIELGQLIFLSSRFASWADIGANTFGAALGVFFTVVFRGRRSRPAADQQ